MGKPNLIDPRRFDPAKIVIGPEKLREMNPQRFEMEQLSGILHIDKAEGLVVGVRNVTADEWWVRGHVPGRPILPGVLILEAAAQLGNFYLNYPDARCLWGFAGLDEVRFRGMVVPGDRIVIAGRPVDIRRRVCKFNVQAFVEERVVVEGVILGMLLFESFTSLGDAGPTSGADGPKGD